MQDKAEELNLVARLSEAVMGDGFMHYGFWPDGLPKTPSLCALGQAQLAYVDRLVQAFPESTTRILDVGSGTGAIALNLTNRGFVMACVSPSERMNLQAKAKLPAETPVHTAKFEEFNGVDTFDICMFAESFHYIELRKALAQAEKLATKGIVIFDYFRRSTHDKSSREYGTRGTHAEFLAEIAKQNVFKVVSDEDMTSNILPTFELLDHLQSKQIAPLISEIRTYLHTRMPIRAWLAEKMLGRALDKIGRPRNRANKFAKSFEYRIISLERI